MERIKVNDTVYECFSVTHYDGFEAILKTDDLEAVKTNFSTVTNIIELNNIGQITNIVSDCPRLVSVTEICEYYLGDDNMLKSVISVKMGTIDLAGKVAALEKQLNPYENEADMPLKDYKQYRINQSKIALEEYLAANPLMSDVHGEEMRPYSITKEKQLLMTQNLAAYDEVVKLKPDSVLTWNYAGGVCEPWTRDEFVLLIAQMMDRVKPLISHQQTLEKKIVDSMDKAEIAAMEFDYDNVPVDEEEVTE